MTDELSKMWFVFFGSSNWRIHITVYIFVVFGKPEFFSIFPANFEGVYDGKPHFKMLVLVV